MIQSLINNETKYYGYSSTHHHGILYQIWNMPINISLAQGRKAYAAKLHGCVDNNFSLCAI
jgi:hypothetical protein